jgi:RNA polymerase sigma factor (sigma-70 family)
MENQSIEKTEKMLKYKSQLKQEETRKIKIKNGIINITFNNLHDRYKAYTTNKAYAYSIKLGIEYDDIYQIILIALWKSWKSEKVEYSIHTLFLNLIKWDMLNYTNKTKKHRHVSIYSTVFTDKNGNEIELIDTLLENDKKLEMTEERQILLKIINKLSDREKKVLLENTLNNKNISDIDIDLDYNKKIYFKNKILDKIRVMYLKYNK